MYLLTANNAFFALLLSVLCVFGDYLVQYAKLDLFRAVFDNATHALVGAVSWLIVMLNLHSRHNSVYEIAFCAIVASFIDIDHFLAARSLNLKDATNLSTRPPFHCSTFPLLFCILLLGLSHIFRSHYLMKISLIVLTAFASHHTRDATRRGYWFYPFGSTQPISYAFYIFITCSIPFAVVWLYEVLIRKQQQSFHKFTDETTVI